MAYGVEFKPSAVRDLKKLPREFQQRVIAIVQTLAENPRPPGARALVGLPDLYRVRVGDCRVIYQVLDNVLLVLVVRIGNRRDVYRGLRTRLPGGSRKPRGRP